jgi:hypothetical protein
MTVIALPSAVPKVRPVPSPSPSETLQPAVWIVPLISITWDDVQALTIARCERCADSLASSDADQIDQWAEAHRCDPELAALLEQVTTGQVA